MSDQNNLRVFTTPKGILRVVEIVTAIVAFGAMASLDHYSDFSEFSFLVAANVLAFVFALAFVVCYVFRQRIDMLCFFFPIAEWTLDAIICLLVFLSSTMAASKCSNGINGFKCTDISNTSDKNNVISAIVFGFFTFVILLALNVLDFYEHKNGEQTEKSAAAAAPAK